MPEAAPHPTKNLLINTALTLFAKEGVRGTTVRKIEEAAGLSPGAGGMYRHFRSKDDLLIAAFDAYYEEVLAFADTLPEVLALGDLRAELRTAATQFRDFHERHDALVRVLLHEGMKLPEAALRRLEQSWQQGYTMYAAWLRRHIADTGDLDVEATAIQLFGALANFHAQRKTFTRPPLGVGDDRFVDSWVEHWAAFLDRANAAPAQPQT